MLDVIAATHAHVGGHLGRPFLVVVQVGTPAKAGRCAIVLIDRHLALVCPAVPGRLGIYKILCHFSKREGDCLPVVGFLLVSFIK